MSLIKNIVNSICKTNVGSQTALTTITFGIEVFLAVTYRVVSSSHLASSSHRLVESSSSIHRLVESSSSSQRVSSSNPRRVMVPNGVILGESLWLIESSS